MATVYMAPEETPDNGRVSVFLAGSIDMGAAVNWQAAVTEGLMDWDIDIYNPRRDDWDWTWEQSIDNPKFLEQVTWELDHLESADIICVNFDPNGKSPITLLEFGLFHNKPMVVCCPKGFWRKGNVDIVCNRYNIILVETIEELVLRLEALICLVNMSKFYGWNNGTN